MAFVIAQLTDIHVGGPSAGSGERFSTAISEINAMQRQPDLVLLTGDLTHDASDEQWQEFLDRLAPLRSPWQAIAGNHDHGRTELAGHRALDAGPLRLVLLDTGSETFTEADAEWLSGELAASAPRPTMIAMHHPPFETGIWWMDCLGLTGAERFEAVVRQHPHVRKVICGHVHRLIQTQWDQCSLWVSPSTSVAVAADLDPDHAPAETAEPPSISLHAFTGDTFVSHVVPIGQAAERTNIGAAAPEFIEWVRAKNDDRPTVFG